jgi:esterase/lipase superfamily enzyme
MVGGFVVSHPQLVTKVIGLEDDELNFLNTLKKGAEKVGGYALHHPELVKKVIGLEDEADNSLFNLGGLLKDGFNIYNDVKTHNYGGLIDHGIQTVKDIKKKH